MNQGTRAIFLLIYTALLFVLNYVAFRTWVPSSGSEGLWFYTGMASIILGNLLVTPFFTKPVDAVSYSVLAGMGIYLVNDLNNWSFWEQTVFFISLFITISVLVIALIAIILNRKTSVLAQKLSKSFMIISDFLGNQKFIFSVVFFYALFEFHRTNPREVMVLGGGWIIIGLIDPELKIINTVNKIFLIWKTKVKTNIVGFVHSYRTPRLVLISQENDNRLPFGTPVIINDKFSENKLGITLNYSGRAETNHLRAIKVTSENQQIAELTNKLKLILPFDSVSIFYTDQHKELLNEIFEFRNIENLVGLVATDTTVNILQFEIIKDIDIEEGKLVEVDIRGKRVLYQIMNGFTKEEVIHQKNTYGYALGKARKIGEWLEQDKKFKNAKWIPELNTPVFFNVGKEVNKDYKTVGHFPDSQYTVEIKDVNALVTHNTAILGILGIGKSMLSIELVERILAEKVKVICIDLTNQYTIELSDFYDSENEEKYIEELQGIINDGGKQNVSRNIEEGGGVNAFKDALKKQISDFLKNAEDSYLKIYNPAQFNVWRQTGGMYNNQAAMVSLTPTEVTQIISEIVLDVCQEIGMTDKARVCLVYEEAHSLIPEWGAVATEGDKSATNATAKAILQGRKFGMGCILITQRTANVTKTILNQCNTIFAMRTFDDTGKTFLANFIGSDYADVLPNLEERSAVFFGKGSNCENPVLIRLNDQNDFREVFREKYPIPENTSPTQEIDEGPNDNSDEDDLPF